MSSGTTEANVVVAVVGVPVVAAGSPHVLRVVVPAATTDNAVGALAVFTLH